MCNKIKLDDYDVFEGRINSLFRNFNVTTENELKIKLFQESKLIPCFCCGREFPPEKIITIHCDPYCLNCARN